MKDRQTLLSRQAHPGSVAVGWVFGLLSLIPFWSHNLVLGIILAIGPSLLVSYLLVQFTDVTDYKNSRLGRYLSAHMSTSLQIVRIVGFVLMVLGAWAHDLIVIALGLSLIILAWLNGVFTTRFNRILREARVREHNVPRNLPR